MEQRALGASGPKLSIIGLGCNNFGMRIGATAAEAVVRAALDAGITHFDTAEMYGGGKSEEFLGAALGSRRDEAVIATKFMPRPAEPYTPGALASRIREGVDGSLRRLGTDRIDLYYQHVPDPDAPIEEALEVLDGLVQAGTVLSIASSNVSAAQIDDAVEVSQARSWAGFTGTQIEWSLLSRAVEEETVPAALSRAMGIVPFFPLASGLLTGKYKRNKEFPEGSRLASSSYFAGAATDENFDKVEAYESFANQRGHTLVELAIGWLLAQPGVTSVIAGATTPEQVRANAAAADWIPNPDELAELKSYRPKGSTA